MSAAHEASARVVALEAVRARDPEHDEKVARELEQLQIRGEARRLYAAENDPHHDQPMDVSWLADDTEEDEHWRVERLLAAGGRMLFVASAKAGKTTTVGNLCRSLLTGQPFLGTFPVEPIDGTVAFLNYEVTGRLIRRWLRDIGVPGDRLRLFNLRGRRNPLATPEGSAELVEALQHARAEVLVVDTFTAAFNGEQNDASEVRRWLATLDQTAELAGCREVVLTAHTGKDGTERARGSTSLEDWPDVITTLVRDVAGTRYLRAYGRDVDIAEDRLDFDAATRRLVRSGSGNRLEAAGRGAERAVELLLQASPNLSGRAITDQLEDSGHSRNAVREAVRRGVVVGWIRTQPGEHRATLHALAPDHVVVPESTSDVSAPQCAVSVPAHAVASSAPPPIGAHWHTITGEPKSVSEPSAHGALTEEERNTLDRLTGSHE